MEQDLRSQFLQNLDTILEEVFEKVHGYCLDKNTSLLETLAGITHEQASVPVGGQCATLAAQVKHTTFYLQVIENSMRDPKSPRVDWGEIWQSTGSVTAEEWRDLVNALEKQYRQIREYMAKEAAFDSEMQVGMAMAVLVHTAYHLGEIRQALCVLRSAA